MSYHWHPERSASWNADKARIVGGAPAGIFDTRYAELKSGDLVPGQWWRVEDEAGHVVGYGWLDVVWGDAEILLAVDPEHRRSGVGAFVLEHLEQEAHRLGLNHLYNMVRPTHPEAEGVTAFLESHGFVASEDGTLRKDARP